MASTSAQPAEVVVERPAEPTQKPEKPRFSSPQQAPNDTRWVVKILGNVPA